MRRKRSYTGFGLWLVQNLSEINMTQKELAGKVGVSKTTISELCTGVRNNERLKAQIRSYILERLAQKDGESKAM